MISEIQPVTMPRKFFSEGEKSCLKGLIAKYKLNITSGMRPENPNIKKYKWRSLTEEFNNIETNSKRTEGQLKKCWDNLKTRHKYMLALERRERMKAAAAPYQPMPTYICATDVEIQYTGDTESLPAETLLEPEPKSIEQEQDVRDSIKNEPVSPTTQRTSSQLSNYEESSELPQAKNVKGQIISQEFGLRRNKYQRAEERDEELHKLKMEERHWLVRAAKENFKKALLERQNAEEELQYNRSKRND